MSYEPKEREEGSVHVYKTSLAADGSFYCWKEFDEKGELVRTSEQMFNSEADAEKAARAVCPSSDIVEVMNVKNINVEANTNVNLVKKGTPADDNFGMNKVNKSIETLLPTDVEKAKVHQNVAKTAVVTEAQAPLVEKAVEEKAEADKKAKDSTEKKTKAEKKAEKEAAKEEDSL